MPTAIPPGISTESLAMRERNFETVRTMITKGLGGDRATLHQYIHPDYVCIVPESLPYGGTYHGVAGYLDVIHKFTNNWDGLTGELLGMAAEDDQMVIVRLMMRGGAGPRKFEMPYVAVWEFRDGKVWRVMPFSFDTALLCDLHARRDEPPGP
jgi:ketosteroid isomerase-like protein